MIIASITCRLSEYYCCSTGNVGKGIGESMVDEANNKHWLKDK